MSVKHHFINTLLIAAALLPVAVTHAAQPILATLQYQDGAKTKFAPISKQSGVVASPSAGKPQTTWRLNTGDVLKGAAVPADRIIRFYSSSNNQPVLVCTVLVKYYAQAGKWTPAYRMEDRVVLARDGAGFKPIPADTGNIELVLMVGTTLPNVDGYFSALRFGIPFKAVGIDAWVVN